MITFVFQRYTVIAFDFQRYTVNAFHTLSFKDIQWLLLSFKDIRWLLLTFKDIRWLHCLSKICGDCSLSFEDVRWLFTVFLGYMMIAYCLLSEQSTNMIVPVQSTVFWIDTGIAKSLWNRHGDLLQTVWLKRSFEDNWWLLTVCWIYTLRTTFSICPFLTVFWRCTWVPSWPIWWRGREWGG